MSEEPDSAQESGETQEVDSTPESQTFSRDIEALNDIVVDSLDETEIPTESISDITQIIEELEHELTESVAESVAEALIEETPTTQPSEPFTIDTGSEDRPIRY